MTYSARALFVLIILSTLKMGWADHALLDDGRVLYNVILPEGATTGTTLTRIRTGSASFGYDPKTNTVFALPGYSVVHKLSDFITTSVPVGRAKATAIVQQRRWDRYTALPERETLVAPPPSPKATPVPLGVAQVRPVPLNVVPETVPLDDRVTRQLDLFMQEQITMAQDATTSMARGLVSPEQSKAEKVRLLQQQKSILQQFFPQTTDTVRLAVDYWGEQVDRASQTGKFDLENL